MPPLFYLDFSPIILKRTVVSLQYTVFSAKYCSEDPSSTQFGPPQCYHDKGFFRDIISLYLQVIEIHRSLDWLSGVVGNYKNPSLPVI